MMHGIVLDATAPLYGRAREIVKVEPLPFPYLSEALRIRRADDAVAAFATWRNKQLTHRLWTMRWQGRTRRPPTAIDARELTTSWREATGA
jgi:hypothetical protein